jgi:hypothetical protein
MRDCVIDTNVLLVASAADPFSPFGGSDVPVDARQKVLDWLVAFQKDSDSCIVWDQTFRIYDEYRNKLSDQDFGLLVVLEKMATARAVDVAFDRDGHAVVPSSFEALDRSDRKFLAVVLGDRGRSRLVNATDTDWLQLEHVLNDSGVDTDHVIENWLRAKHAEKESRK